MKRKYSTIQIHLLRGKKVKTIEQKPLQERLWLYLIQGRISLYRKDERTATDLPDQEKRVSVGHDVYQLYKEEQQTHKSLSEKFNGGSTTMLQDC